MLFGKKSCNSFNKDDFLAEIQSAEQKCHKLEQKFSAKSTLADLDENTQLALCCKRCADTLNECAELVSQMLPPRDKHKAKVFETKSKDLLLKLMDTLQECENFDYPVKNGILEKIANDLKSLIFDITAI